MRSTPKWEEADFQVAIEAAANALILVDSARSILFANEKASALFGYSKKELMGRQVEMLLPERFRSRHPGLVAEYWKKPVARPIGIGRDLHGIRKDGKEIPVEIGLHPVIFGGETFVIASIVDITERKALEQRLRDVARLKSDMISLVSHEYANHLGSMQLALFLLKDSEPPNPKESRRNSYAVLHRAVEHLKVTTANFLQLNRLESGKLVMNFRPKPLQTAVEEALVIMRPLAEAKQLRLGSQSDFPEGLPPPVRADPEALALVITNLVSNAIKYTPKGGSVTVRISKPRGGAPGVRFSVEDTGIGIAMPDIERVFSGFYRTTQSREVAKGFGVGLKVVQELLDRHGSRLELDSTPGQGSKFSFTLPLWTEASDHPMADGKGG